MKLKIAFLLAILIGLAQLKVTAQELNCSVEINSDQIQVANKRVYTILQKAIFEFMNNTKWTSESFTTDERIGMSIYITIKENPSPSEFIGQLQIQSYRPVYMTGYKTTMFNYNDNDFSFSYVENDPLDFSLNNFTSNLTSVLAYYAYLVIGLDYDSFSLNGGDKYLQAAQTIVNNASSSNFPGWKAFDGSRNRYWIIQHLLSPPFIPFRTAFYEYHRKGLDQLESDLDGGRQAVTKVLEKLETVHNNKPNTFMMQLFFMSKSDELVNLYSDAFPDVKSKVKTILSKIDPANIAKYEKI